MNKIKRLLAASIAGVCMFSLIGCGCNKVYFSTGLTENEVFKIDGTATTVNEAMLYLTCEKNLYENSYGSEIWKQDLSEGLTLLDYIKNIVKERLAQVSALNQLAKDEKIKLTEKEIKKVSKASEAFYNGLTDEEIEYMDTSLEIVTNAYAKYALAQKVYDELTKDINPEISDAEALMIKVQSIYIKTYSYDAEGNKVAYTKSERKKAKSRINELYKEVTEDGEDFLEIANKYSDADEVEYVFGKGEMVEEFEKTAFSLKDDEISKVVVTDDGYYIIKCIEDYMIEETQSNKERILAKAKDDEFIKIYEPFLETLSSEFNDKVWNSIEFTDGKNINTCNFYDIYNKYMEE